MEQEISVLPEKKLIWITVNTSTTQNVIDMQIAESKDFDKTVLKK